MRRVAPLITSHAVEITSLREENASLFASIAVLQENNNLLREEIAALRLENEKLAELAPNTVVRSLCEKVAEMAQETKEYLRLLQAREENSRVLSESLKTLCETVCSVKKYEEELEQRIVQLEGGIVTLQEANHLKSLEVHRLKQCAHELREHLTCSISHEPMIQPCVLSTGQVYEHGCIMQWLRQGNTCPNTGTRVMNHDYITPTSATLRNVCAVVARM